MLDYARQRAMEVLKIPRSGVFVTNGPAGVQVSEVSFEAVGLELYILVPWTSDHLFNLGHDPFVTLLTAIWVLKGKVRILLPNERHLKPGLLQTAEKEGCVIVQADPCQVHIRREEGWGFVETIDISSH